MITIADICKAPERFAGKIAAQGWVATARLGKTLGFLELHDGTCFSSVQVVFASGLGEGIRTGCAVRVTGALQLTPEAPQPFEIHAEKIELAGDCPADYPLQKKRHTPEYLRSMQALRPRANTFRAVFRVRDALARAIHDFFGARGFLYVHTPILTGSDCEGAGQMFAVTTLPLADIPKTESGAVDFDRDFFGRAVNLTVSGQLYGEAFAAAFRNIYTFGPTFRAEHSNTARHAAEFWMIEPEMAFCDLKGNMDMAEAMVKSIIRDVMARCPDEMAFLGKHIDTGLSARLANVLAHDFARITYTEAVEILQASGQDFAYPVAWGKDLQTEHERYLTERVFEKPVFVTDYPKKIKSFYMRANDDGKTVAACDLLVPGVGEIIGGSQREERYAVLKARMEALSMRTEDYDWYLDLRRYGSAGSAGFGLGFERMLMYVTGISNIRDVIPFPRTAGSLTM